MAGPVPCVILNQDLRSCSDFLALAVGFPGVGPARVLRRHVAKTAVVGCDHDAILGFR